MALRKQIQKDASDFPSESQQVEEDEALDDGDDNVKKCEHWLKSAEINTRSGALKLQQLRD